jgi:hypothetical protein
MEDKSTFIITNILEKWIGTNGYPIWLLIYIIYFPKNINIYWFLDIVIII